MTKRPWTTGPWQRKNNVIVIDNRFRCQVTMDRGRITEWDANSALMQRSPDMAELLINLTKSTSENWFDIKLSAKKLLKEVGYGE